MSCEDQAMSSTKVCTRYTCDKEPLVARRGFYVCPMCDYGYGEHPHPDLPSLAAPKKYTLAECEAALIATLKLPDGIDAHVIHSAFERLRTHKEEEG